MTLVALTPTSLPSLPSLPPFSRSQPAIRSAAKALRNGIISGGSSVGVLLLICTLLWPLGLGSIVYNWQHGPFHLNHHEDIALLDPATAMEQFVSIAPDVKLEKTGFRQREREVTWYGYELKPQASFRTFSIVKKSKGGKDKKVKLLVRAPTKDNPMLKDIWPLRFENMTQKTLDCIESKVEVSVSAYSKEDRSKAYQVSLKMGIQCVFWVC